MNQESALSFEIHVMLFNYFARFVYLYFIKLFFSLIHMLCCYLCCYG